MTKLFFMFLCFSIFALQSFAQSKETRKFASLTTLECEGLKSLSYGFRNEINDSKNSKGYVIVYEGRKETPVYKNGSFEKYQYLLPLRGELNQQIRLIRGMFNFMEIPQGKIKILNGGFREKFTIEFWINPNGAKSPKPTPTLKQMKYRRGKLYRFVYFNC